METRNKFSNHQYLGLGLLGEENLYENFFVCIVQGKMKNEIRLEYAKSATGKEIGKILATQTFQTSIGLSFYTFAGGDKKVSLNTVELAFILLDTKWANSFYFSTWQIRT